MEIYLFIYVFTCLFLYFIYRHICIHIERTRSTLAVIIVAIILLMTPIKTAVGIVRCSVSESLRAPSMSKQHPIPRPIACIQTDLLHGCCFCAAWLSIRQLYIPPEVTSKISWHALDYASQWGNLNFGMIPGDLPPCFSPDF